ncbi:MAG: hypothetical protein J7L61_01915 [Thermoplasmata archaeon]|nr:hypothetical protein [Thermoplasmata archaeon]
MRILEWMKGLIGETLGIGSVDEIVTMTFNELGTSAPYMTDNLWPVFAEKVIEKVRGERGHSGGRMLQEMDAGAASEAEILRVRKKR